MPYLQRSELPPEHQDVLTRNIAINQVLANSPGAARAFGDLGMFIRHRSRLDPRLRQLAIMQIGWSARSPYEWSHHVQIGRDAGVTRSDIANLAIEAAGIKSSIDALARLVLRGAREMWEGPGMSAATFAALHDELGKECLTDLVVAIAYYCGVVRILATLEVEVEPEWQPYLVEFPLPP
nr:carboxymuconolactone decarboxylase family protein [Plastoroseomonas hellenica]